MKDKLGIGLFVVVAAWIIYRGHTVPPEEGHFYVSLLSLVLMTCFAWLCLRIAQWKNLSNLWQIVYGVSGALLTIPALLFVLIHPRQKEQADAQGDVIGPDGAGHQRHR